MNGMTLTEFLLERISEDEVFARAHYGMDLDYWPNRMLAECETNRRIIARLRKIAQEAHRTDDGWTAADSAFVDTLRLLALPYADHPDYREEWRP